jgi:hypothetical protein
MGIHLGRCTIFNKHLTGMNIELYVRRMLRRMVDLSLIAMLLFFTSCAKVNDAVSARQLSIQFRNEFGAGPPNDVSVINGREIAVGDTTTRWISFKCSKATYAKIMSSNFKEVDRAKLDEPWKESRGDLDRFDIYARNANTPEWWPNMKNVSFDVISYRILNSGFWNGYVFAVFDSKRQIVYVHSSAYH